MNRNEIIQFIEVNHIDKNSPVIFTIIENGQEIEYKGRIEFNFNGSPAITDEKVGIRIQMIKDASDMPYAGGVLFDNIVNIRTND
jgi:hypothetical protein